MMTKKKKKETMETYSQSNQRNIRKLSLEYAKILIVRSKVMTPLTTTMCLLQSKPYNTQQRVAQFRIYMT